MRRGQGSLEYLLIVAAILAVAIVVVMVAQSMLGAPQQSTRLTQDKYLAGINGVEFPDYTVFYDGKVAPPTRLVYNDETYDIIPTIPPAGVELIEIASIGADEVGEPFPVYFATPDGPAYLPRTGKVLFNGPYIVCDTCIGGQYDYPYSTDLLWTSVITVFEGIDNVDVLLVYDVNESVSISDIEVAFNDEIYAQCNSGAIIGPGVASIACTIPPGYEPPPFLLRVKTAVEMADNAKDGVEVRSIKLLY